MRFNPEIRNFSDVQKQCLHALLEKGELYKKNWDIYQKYHNAAKELKKTKSVVDILHYFMKHETRASGGFVRWLRTRGILETDGTSSAHIEKDPLRFAKLLDARLDINRVDGELGDVLDI